VVTEERADEMRTLLTTPRGWAQGRPDVDVVLLTEDRAPYLEDVAWVREVGGVRPHRTRRWGAVTQRRFALPSGLEVELVVAPPSWAATDPVAAGTRRVTTDGAPILYEPKGARAWLVDACGRSGAMEGYAGSGVGHA
jgi:hypothetical protein